MSNNPQEDQAGLVNLYTLDEAAAVLNVSRSQLLAWIQQNDLPIVRLGSGPQMVRIRHADLAIFAAEFFGSPSSGIDMDDDDDSLVKGE
jgi:excisionase family DNA binding protein